LRMMTVLLTPKMDTGFDLFFKLGLRNVFACGICAGLH
jgi:hypothetical protein